MRMIWPLLFLLCHATALWAQAMDRATLQPMIVPPYALGETSFWWYDADKAAKLKTAGVLK